MRTTLIFIAFLCLTVYDVAFALKSVPCVYLKSTRWSTMNRSYKTCTLSLLSNDEEFTIASDVDDTVEAFDMKDDKKVTHIPHLASIYPSLAVVQVFNCSVTALDDSSFKNLWKLRYLSMTLNQIEFVSKDNFKDLVSLEYLLFDSNKIRYIAAGSFDSLINLKKLHLHGNSIQHIHSKLFNAMENLRELSFGKNEISFLHPNIFKALVNVESIRMYENDIWSLSEDMFAALVNLKNISLFQNNLVQIPDRLFEKNTKLEWVWMSKNQIKLVNPRIFENKASLQYVDLKGNQCIKKIYRTADFGQMQKDLKEHCSDPEGVRDERIKSLEDQIAVLADKVAEIGSTVHQKFQEVAIVF